MLIFPDHVPHSDCLALRIEASTTVRPPGETFAGPGISGFALVKAYGLAGFYLSAANSESSNRTAESGRCACAVPEG